jgi:hypothetical protein
VVGRDLLWFQDVGALLCFEDQWEGKHSRTAPVSHERVALGIHCVSATDDRSEDERLEAAFETYDLMSEWLLYPRFANPLPFRHDPSTVEFVLFLVQIVTVIHGIYDTLKRCAVISKSASGIGFVGAWLSETRNNH